MAQVTENYGLYLEDNENTKFKEWREKMNGPKDSNMIKIDAAIEKKQDKLTGKKGQLVGFDVDGSPVAQDAPESGVSSFNGRTGAIEPQIGDYTADMVGAAPQSEIDAINNALHSQPIALCLNANASGNCAIAIGASANASGSNSTALGRSANASAESSVAIGDTSKAIGEYYSTAIGFNSNATDYSVALGGQTSSSNSGAIAVGYFAHGRGSYSTCIGYSAYSDGTHSIALGKEATSAQTGSIAIGATTYVSGLNSVAIGYCAECTNNNSIQLGNASSLSSITARVSLTITSDERDKTDIKPVESGAVDFLNKIKAIRYVWNGRERYIDEESLSDEDKEKRRKYGLCTYDKEAHAKGTKKGSRIRVGILAQEVQAALADVYGSSSYANLVNDNLFDYDDVPDDVESRLAVNYEGFIPFLIKAVQELDTRLKNLEGE